MLIAMKPWVLNSQEWARCLAHYVTCRDTSRITSVCRRCGRDIPAGGQRVAFTLRTSSGQKQKAGFICRDCIDAAKHEKAA